MNNSSPYALITGASSGIGYQFARELAKKKFNLIIVSNEDLKNQEVCLILVNEFNIKAIPFFIDLTRPESAETLFNFCIEQQLDVDILINNAGMFFFKEIPDTSPEMVSKILMLHIVTSTLLSTYFSNYMRQKKSGHILFISSITAWMSYPGISLYGATKGYLRQFARSLRYEMKDYHVNISVVCPSAIDTNLYNLSEKQRSLALRTGVMMCSQALAKKSLSAMFKKRFLYIPGFLAKISVCFVLFVPPFVIQRIKRYMWKKLKINGNH
ncbi:MAG: SDR family NAD(P)-dependent oxidoreductase [Bacteroidales bacterium]|jgi:short-subunit dehydrogenase|nr:SDR family NAD(P)-dependent oxidoreductase [Bacteroidales bacterium]